MSLSDQTLQFFPVSTRVSVLRARGLRIKGKDGTNDAYAALQAGRETFRTPVAEKRAEPVWGGDDAAFIFTLPAESARAEQDGVPLQVRVLHRVPLGADKLLGLAVINVHELRQNSARENPQWFKLLNKAGKADKERGEVLLDIQFLKSSMSVSMIDLSDKSHSRLGKFKDKLRGKKKDGLSDSASAILPSVSQVLTDSEGEMDGVTEGEATKKKKNKLKSLFVPKSNMKRNSMSQSMSSLGTLPDKNSSISSSTSSGLNVESSEGKKKKKFPFLTHKRNSSTDSKASNHSDFNLGSTNQNPPSQIDICINGSQVYKEETQSGEVQEMEEEEEEEGEKEEEEERWRREEEEQERLEEERRSKAEEERKRKEKEEQRRRIEAEEKERIRVEREKEEQRRKMAEEKERIRMEREKEEERKRTEEEEKERIRKEREIEEQRRRIEEEEKERIQIEREMEEQKRKMVEEEKERIRMEREKEEQRRKMAEEKERIRMEREMEEERRRMEQDEKERLRIEREKEEQRRKMAEEKERIRMEEERRRMEEEEKERLRIEREKEEQRRKMAEEKERIRMEREMEEERRRIEEEAKERRMIEREKEEQRRKMVEEKERTRMEKEKEEERRRIEEEAKERRRIEKEKEELRRRMEEEEKEKQRIEKEEQRRMLQEEERMRMKREKEEQMRELEEERKRKEEKEAEELRRKMEKENDRKKAEDEEKMRTAEEEKMKEEKKRAERERMIQEEEKKKEKKRIEMEGRLADEKKVREDEERRIAEEKEKQRKEEERVRKEKERKMEIKRKEEELERRNMEMEEKKKKEKQMREGQARLGKEDSHFEETVISQSTDFTRSARISNVKPSVSISATVSLPTMANTNPFLDDDLDASISENNISVEETTAKKGRAPLPPQLTGPDVSSRGDSKQHSQLKEVSKRPAPQPPGREVTAKINTDQAGLGQGEKKNPGRHQESNILPVKQDDTQVDTNPFTCDGPAAVKPNKRPAPKPENGITVSEDTWRNDGKNMMEGIVDYKEKATASDDNKSNLPNLKLLSASNDITVEDVKSDLTDDPPQKEERPGNKVELDSAKPNPPSYANQDLSMERSQKKSRAPLPPTKPKRTGDLNKTNLEQAQKNHSDKKDQDNALVSNAEIPAVSTPSSTTVSSSTVSPLAEKSLVMKLCTSESMETDSGSGSRVLPWAKVVPSDAGEVREQVVPTSVIRQHAVKPLSAAENQPENHESRVTDNTQLKSKAPEAVMKGPYSQLTQPELISLALRQQEQISRRDARIQELEQYIDNLLVRVMEEKPSILMTLNAKNKFM